MKFNSQNIIEICNKNLSSFRNSLEAINYEKGGIYNSEMLLFVSLIKYFGVKLIIESGITTTLLVIFNSENAFNLKKLTNHKN